MAFGVVEDDEVVALADVFRHCFVFVKLRAKLIEIGHLKFCSVSDTSTVRCYLFEQDFEQGALSGPIGTDEADFIAPHDDG